MNTKVGILLKKQRSCNSFNPGFGDRLLPQKSPDRAKIPGKSISPSNETTDTLKGQSSHETGNRSSALENSFGTQLRQGELSSNKPPIS